MSRTFTPGLLLSLVLILTPSPAPTEHDGGGRGGGASRREDAVRIVRTKGRTTIKELLDNGIRNTFIENGKSHSTTWTLTDFKSEKITCTDGKGRLIAAAVEGKVDRVVEVAEKLGFRTLRIGLSDSVVLEYDCEEVTLDRIQRLYFSRFVEYVEPDVKVSIAGGVLD